MHLALTWDNFEAFLRIRKNQSHKSISGHKGRYLKLAIYFKTVDFTPTNFDKFLYDEIEKQGKSNSLYNNYLKTVKHLASYLGIKEEFSDYSYRDDHTGQPEHVLTPKQIQSLAECHIKYERFKNRKEKHKALIYFLGTVGSRIDEALHLEWSDLKISDSPVIHFRKEITKGRRGERDCPIPKWLLKLLLSLPRENQYIFSKIEQTNFREDLVKRCKVIKLGFNITPHDLRDSSINNKLDVEIPMEKVSAYHGHSSINTTYKYYVRIQSKKTGQILKQKDPAFQSDLDYPTAVLNTKEAVEKLLVSRVCEYVYKENINPKTGLKETWIGLIEK